MKKLGESLKKIMKAFFRGHPDLDLKRFEELERKKTHTNKRGYY